jgi:hypothetical protein
MCVLYSLHAKSKYKLIATKFLLKKINEQLFTQFCLLPSPLLLLAKHLIPYWHKPYCSFKYKIYDPH